MTSLSGQFASFLAYLNDVLQAVIVIFGAAVVLYNLPRLDRGAVIRSFTALIFFVVLVYFTELLISRTVRSDDAELFLRLGWVGIAMVPAAQFHLSDALLTITGKFSQRRHRLIWAGYAIGVTFALAGAFTDYVVAPPVGGMPVPRLSAGLLFPLFAGYFWLLAVGSVYNVWRARGRTLTSATRKRMTITLLAILAAPLGVFPYMIFARDPASEVPLILWPIVIVGNLVVSALFAFLTSQIVYFGAASPERVVRVRLFKYMARVPLAATIVLLTFVIVNRMPSVLGLDKSVALGVTVVATLMLVEWFVHVFKRPLERLFQLDDDPDVRRLQLLSERLLTTGEVRDFLESVLAATCEALRTPTAFVVSMTARGARLEAVVGSLDPTEQIVGLADWGELARSAGQAAEHGENGQPELAAGFFIWQDFWMQPLYGQDSTVMLGVMGVRARAAAPDLSAEELLLLGRLKDQAASAIEDRLLQEGVFATVEGLLPEITALQERRRAATFGGLPVLAAEPFQSDSRILQNPEFSNMVRDALNHYWGGPKLTESPLLDLQVVRQEMQGHDNNPASALRAILGRAIEQQKPESQRSLTTGEWILYNILDLKFVQGRRVRDVARRLAMSESDLYRKQRVAIENVARTIAQMEQDALDKNEEPNDSHQPTNDAATVSSPLD